MTSPYVRPNKVTVVSSPGCGACELAKDELREVGAEFVVVNFKEMSETDQKYLRDFVHAHTADTKLTFPQIFIGKTYVENGCRGLIRLKESDELERLLDLEKITIAF